MSFAESLDSIFPTYLVDADKNRLKNALRQFTRDNLGKEFDYSQFYRDYQCPYFLQADLVREIRFPQWSEAELAYSKRYTNAVILSNTCDLSPDNKHDHNDKQCLCAPLLEFDEYIQDLKEAHFDTGKIDSYSKAIQSQQISNLVYLPALSEKDNGFIVLLDQIFWFPTEELNSYLPDIHENRIMSLDRFGHYLMVLKLSYHLCRLPEEDERGANSYQKQ